MIWYYIICIYCIILYVPLCPSVRVRPYVRMDLELHVMAWQGQKQKLENGTESSWLSGTFTSSTSGHGRSALLNVQPRIRNSMAPQAWDHIPKADEATSVGFALVYWHNLHNCLLRSANTLLKTFMFFHSFLLLIWPAVKYRPLFCPACLKRHDMAWLKGSYPHSKLLTPTLCF